MKAIRGPYPYTPWTYHIQIAISINLHAVWYTVHWTTWLRTEDPSVAQSTVRVKVVYVDISLGGIINIQLGAVWRKREPIRIFQVLCQQFKLTVQSAAIDAFKGEFLFLTARQVSSWISKVDSAIRTEHHVVGTVQTLALVMIHDYFVTLAIGRQTDDRAQNAGTV
jgi:hypothetical protein